MVPETLAPSTEGLTKLKLNGANINAIVRGTRFRADSLEKLLRLRELLTEFHKHSFLRNKLVLKGGAALILFYLDLARLSRDIDLNYVSCGSRPLACNSLFSTRTFAAAFLLCRWFMVEAAFAPRERHFVLQLR